MQIDPQSLSPRERYRTLIACLIPRPIAWVSTLDRNQLANLAPFSFFGGVTAQPPTVMLSVGRRRGEQKDTARNVLATREAVIHIPHRRLAEAMVATSAEVAPEVDEFTLVGLATAPAIRVKPPRLADAAIALESRLVKHLEVGTGPSDLFLLEVVQLHLADTYLDAGLPMPQKLAAVGRLGGDEYCDTTRVFSIPRPRPR
jgi:flavin reductase (DIM6/NTAB) family NADH-FMN oxidoreductase RutF